MIKLQPPVTKTKGRTKGRKSKTRKPRKDRSEFARICQRRALSAVLVLVGLATSPLTINSAAFVASVMAVFLGLVLLFRKPAYWCNHLDEIAAERDSDES